MTSLNDDSWYLIPNPHLLFKKCDERRIGKKLKIHVTSLLIITINTCDVITSFRFLVNDVRRLIAPKSLGNVGRAQGLNVTKTSLMATQYLKARSFCYWKWVSLFVKKRSAFVELSPKQMVWIINRTECREEPREACRTVVKSECRDMPRLKCDKSPKIVKENCQQKCEPVYWCKVCNSNWVLSH